MAKIFVCPQCHGQLDKSTQSRKEKCSSCHAVYPKKGKVFDFRTIMSDAKTNWNATAFETAYTKHSEQMVDGFTHALMSGIPDYAEEYRQQNKGKLVKDFVEKKRPATLLDLGCGYGWFCFELQQLSPDTRCYGLDICEFRVNIFKREIDKSPIREQFDVALSNAEQLPFPDSCLDIVVMREVIEHLQDPGQALKEIQRVLKPDGFLLITTPTKLMTGFWETVAILPTLVKRVLKREQIMRSSKAQVYDKPLSVNNFKNILKDSKLEVTMWKRVIFLPHESYLQFIPKWLLKIIIFIARIIDKLPILHFVGLHHVVFAKTGKPSME